MRAKTMILLPIALIIVALDLVQFIGYFALSHVYIDIVLDGIITRLHCFVFSMQLAMNRVLLYAITSISSFKLHVCIVMGLLV